MARNVRSRRRELLEVSLRLFRERGYAGTPVSSISGAMGMSKAGILHYFPHKEDLLHALLDPLFEKVEVLVSREPEREELLKEYLCLMIEERELIALLGSDLSVLAQPGIGDKARELNDRLLELLAGEEATPTDQVRAEHALGGMRAVVVRFAEEDPETVREVGLKAAAAALAPQE